MRKLQTSEIGAEPNWINKPVVNEQSELIGAFNWYNYNYSKKEAKEFVLDYLKQVKKDKDVIASFKSLPESKYNVQFGWLSRMFTLGFTPSEKTKEFFKQTYNNLLVLANESVKNDPLPVEDTTPKVSIQDRIREKAAEEAGEIEGMIDDFILSGCKKSIDMEYYFKSRKLSSVVMNKICDVFIERAKEIEEVMVTDDPQLKEGYSNFSKVELRKFKEFLDSIVVAANAGAVANKPTRKKRKVKEKPAALVVAKMNYMKEFPDLNLVSVSPEKIIGSQQVWAYNTKTKLLGVYNADNAKGITVKGSTLQNFNAETSIGKRLRKPEVVLPDLLGAGKIRIKKILPELTTKELNLTGRMNSDTIIVRVIN
jgi:hypothetical protein